MPDSQFALVVHVDLTVLVWFLAFSGVLWSYTDSRRCLDFDWIELILASLGTIVIMVSLFTGESYSLMNSCGIMFLVIIYYAMRSDKK